MRSFVDVFNSSIAAYLRTVCLQNILRRPRRLPFFLQALWRQYTAVRRRAASQALGVHVPPMLIISVTNRCNFSCAGCYNASRPAGGDPGGELTTEEMRSLLAQARTLGSSLVLFAGGEPLTRKDLFTVVSGFPEMLCTVFTNGVLIDAARAAEFRRYPHIIPVLSLEGGREETDHRRGAGSFDAVMRAFGLLHTNGVLFGSSITVTRENFDRVTAAPFVEEIAGRGCGLFFFVEYVPVQEGTMNLTITPEQRAELIARMPEYDKKFGAAFTAFPGDEERFGGCLAAGRGFVHVNASGDVEPCPFAPYADRNIRRVSLRSALSSDFLAAIRQGHGKLTETTGGCALWSNREWVASLMNKR